MGVKVKKLRVRLPTAPPGRVIRCKKAYKRRPKHGLETHKVYQNCNKSDYVN